MEPVENFIDQFNKLERHLSKEQHDSSQKGFKYKLRKSKNPVIKNQKNMNFLEISAELRNLIVHNTDLKLAAPTQDFVNRFEKLVNEIISPQKVDQIMIKYNKLSKCEITDTFQDAYNLMQEHLLTNIPVFKDGKFIGMFSESTLFHHTAYQGEELIIMSDTKLEKIISALDVDDQPSLYYKFISKKTNVYQALDYFLEEPYKNEKRLELLLVTEHGKKGESLLGIVSPYDLLSLIN